MDPQHKYWRKSRTFTAIALSAWLVLTVLVGTFGAKASLALYVAIIGLYNWYISKLDRSYRDG